MTNCRFELGAAQTLTLPDATFDVVTSTFAMHHILEAQRPADLLAAVDIRRYRDMVRAAGFGTLTFSAVRPSTGVLLATKDIRG